MAEIKSYPNNVNTEIGAEHVMRWHHGRTSGVFGALAELAVAALTTPSMAVTVSDGDGWLADQNGNGIHFWNDIFVTTAALLQLSIDTADGILNRIDRVIVEWSTPNYTQLPEIKILKGTSATSPVAPSLTNSTSLRQISLARIAVAAGTLAITAGMITDERFEPSVCGIVTETTVVDTSGAAAQFNEVLGEAQQLVNDLQGEAVINHAATHEPGGDDETKFVYYGGTQALTDAQKAQALRNLGTDAALYFTNQAVPVSGWAAFTASGTEETALQTAGYTYRKAVELTGITASMKVRVDPSIDIESCGTTIWRENQAYAGGIYLYAKAVPTNAFTLLTIEARRMS